MSYIEKNSSGGGAGVTTNKYEVGTLNGGESFLISGVATKKGGVVLITMERLMNKLKKSGTPIIAPNAAA